jgi:hypothetical protein
MVPSRPVGLARRSGVWIAFGVAALIAGATCAQRIKADEPASIEPSPSIATRIRWVQFHMVSGRVIATSPMVVQRMLVPTSTNQRGGRREVLSIEINSGIASLQYDLVAQGERLQIAVTGGNQLSISHGRSTEGYQLEYRQLPDGPVELTIDSNGQKRVWKADGYWQIDLAEPEVVRRRLAPLLELLRPSWQLAHLGSEIEDALLTRPSIDQKKDLPRWTEWVDRLASPRFAARQQAQRELLQAGQAVLPVLQSLDKGQLDAEQAYRVRTLIESLAIDYEDRVDRVAATLANSADVWLSLMARDELAKRRVAAKRLTSLVGHEIEFDPAADQTVRPAQLQVLREQLAQPMSSAKLDQP